MALTLAEELFLLSLDRRGTAGRRTEAALAAAVITDLGRQKFLRSDHARNLRGLGSPGIIEPPLHDEARLLITSSQKPRDAAGWVRQLPKHLGPLRAAVAEALVTRGVLREERTKRLGLFETVRYPVADPGPLDAARNRLLEVLIRRASPTERDALLLGLLARAGAIGQVLDGEKDAKLATLRALKVAKHGLAGRPGSSSSTSSVSNDLQEISDILD